MRLADPADDDARAIALRARLEGSGLVSIAEGEVAAAACIYRLPARDRLSSSSPVPQVGTLAEPRWAVVGATGDLLMPLKTLDDLDTIVENLERIAKYRQVLAIENPDPQSRLRGQFTLALQTFSFATKTWSEAAPAADRGQIVCEEGDIIRFVVRSRHDAPVFVSLHDFGLSWKTEQIYPARGAQEKLRARGELFCEPQRLGFPAVDPAIQPADRPAPTEGIETVKLFVTEQPTDLSAFEQEGVQGDAPPTPLAVLLSVVFDGRTTRDEAPVSLEDDDWTTVSTSFVLRRRVKEST